LALNLLSNAIDIDTVLWFEMIASSMLIEKHILRFAILDDLNCTGCAAAVCRAAEISVGYFSASALLCRCSTGCVLQYNGHRSFHSLKSGAAKWDLSFWYSRCVALEIAR
jgi:hypothetical protein